MPLITVTLQKQTLKILAFDWFMAKKSKTNYLHLENKYPTAYLYKIFSVQKVHVILHSTDYC